MWMIMIFNLEYLACLQKYELYVHYLLVALAVLGSRSRPWPMESESRPSMTGGKTKTRPRPHMFESMLRSRPDNQMCSFAGCGPSLT